MTSAEVLRLLSPVTTFTSSLFHWLSLLLVIFLCLSFTALFTHSLPFQFSFLLLSPFSLFVNFFLFLIPLFIHPTFRFLCVWRPWITWIPVAVRNLNFVLKSPMKYQVIQHQTNNTWCDGIVSSSWAISNKTTHLLYEYHRYK